MKKILFTSVASLGLMGSAVGYGQTTPTNDPRSSAAFPLFISNLFNNSISSISASGGVNPGFVPSGSIQNPDGLASDGSGNIYAATYDGTNSNITRFNASTGVAQVLPGTLPAVPTGLTFGSGNTLYATTNFSSVIQIDPSNGAFIRTVASTLGTANGALFASQGLVQGPDGNLYVANPGNNQIVQVNPNGGAINTFSLAGLSAPTGLVFDHNALFVTNNTGSTVTGYNFAGGTFTLNTAISSQNPAFTTILNGPEGLTVGPDGNIYVANDTGTVSGMSNIDQIAVTRDANGNITSLGAPTVFAMQAASLGAAFVVFAVPEPSTYAMFAVAGATMAFFGVRRRMSAARA